MSKIIGNTTATPNPRPDWAQADSTKADFIKNKPALGDLAAKNTVDKTDLAADVQTSLNKVDTALQSETDPTVPAWAKESTKPTYNLSEVSDTSSYVRMTPDERTKLSGLANVATSGSYNDLADVPSTFEPSAHVHDYIPTVQKGAANGVAELDANGKVPSAQLPSYVDDVLEYSAKASFPVTGETGKIYIDTTTNITYRWGGSTYVPIGSDLALGETSSTAYYGDKGKVAYEHAMIEDGNPHGVTADMVGALPLSGGTMTGELRVNGGDKVGGSKIVLETGTGQITNDGTQTLFGFLGASKIGVGHSSYELVLRGNAARPTYNNKDMALKSDVDAAIGDINSILDAINGEVV